MKSNWLRLLGIYGLIFIFFGAVAAVFFHETFLAPAAYVEMGIGLIAVIVYLINFFGDATKSIWRKRDAVFGGAGAFLVLLILIGVNVIAHTKWGDKKFDLTTNKIHSLSEASVETLKNLPEKIEVLSFVTDPRAKKLLSNLVNKYTSQSNKIEFRSIDPDQEPTLLETYEAQVDQVVLRNPKSDKSITLDGAQFNEQEFTTALRRLFVENEINIYFLQGHGEGQISDDKTQKGLFLAKFLLEREGYKVHALDLTQTGAIPANANAVVAWGAERPVSAGEVSLLQAYLEKGGKLVLAQDPLVSPARDRILPSGYEELLKTYGLKFGNSILVQNLNFQNRSIRSATVLGLNYTDHPIVKDLQGNLTQFSLSQSIDLIDTKKEKENQQALVLTGEDVASVKDVSKLSGNQDLQSSGPFAIARIVSESQAEDSADQESEKTSAKGYQLVVFGDSDFASNQNIQNGYNRDLFLNTFAYLLGETENITIRPKTWKNSTLEISDEQKRAVYFASIFIVPQLIILLGLGIWAMRRNRV